VSYVERGDAGSGDGFEDRDYDRVGIEPGMARAWRRWGIEPLEAARWIAHGITEPVDAVRWSPAVQPEQVKELVEAGLDSALLARWREHGASVKEAIAGVAKGQSPEDRTQQRSTSSLRIAMRGTASGRGLRAVIAAEAIQAPADEADEAFVQRMAELGSMAHSYLRVGWVERDALPWALIGIDPLDARDWMLLGLTPAEAAECEGKGQGPVDVALEWWRGGFQPEEIAPWLGAGLTPEEAGDQKATGVTLEQAAVLRSLRQGERRTGS
jgi:hypothetical protein